MIYEEINSMISEIGLPFAYQHFSEGESPSIPFIVFDITKENPFSADNIVYFSTKSLEIALYTAEKSPNTEKAVEDVLTAHELFYSKSETWVSGVNLYEILYELEV